MTFYPPARALPSLAFLSAFLWLQAPGPGVARADTVIADDQIVQGSLAVGFGAVDGESFGFDTIRLKEDNTRISFMDTSTSSGFPSNDWQIVANDPTSGGRNFLGFRDLGPTGGGSEEGPMPFYVLAGAGNDALVVHSSGRIGLGTASPALKIHMINGNTPGLRLEQDGTSGFTPQTWDIGANEANFFVRDTTGGSRLPFRIRPGAPTSTLDLNASGAIGMGTASPRAKLDIAVNTTTGTEGVLIADLQSPVATNSATLHVEGTAFIAKTLEIGSSRERKENIRDLTLAEAEEALGALNPVEFNYKADSERQLGFIAEDVPDLVATQNRKSLVPMDFVAVLTKVVQKHEQRERELQKAIEAQQQALAKLAARLDALEQGRGAARPLVTKVSNIEALRAERARRQDDPTQAIAASAAKPTAPASEFIEDGGRR